MSTQSGIVANDDLLCRVNGLNKEGTSIVAGINGDSTEVEYISQCNSIEELESYIGENSTKACYVIVRGATGFHFLNFTPDAAHVREKMLFASTSNTLQRQIGSNHILSTSLLTEPKDFVQQQWRSQDSPKAYTESEIIKRQIDEQLDSEVHSRDAHPLVSQTNGSGPSLSFKIQESSAVDELLAENNLLTFGIDLASEQIDLASKKTISSPKQLVGNITREKPSYTLYQSTDEKTFFIYSCPSGSKVKERMIYAANKQGFINHLQNKDQMSITKSIEVGDPEELELSIFDLKADLEEPINPQKYKFGRPKGPHRRSA
ncbi:twinfilin TWF1 Ecym_5444 [Eremothecium cymbalariae DBVPG|uniref:ADF-H domain-containing protein n=1 Tax=Eremothecium cymbalariae (strain CBS 270.75 / DBVPG 7215 / KCTC 17166 / NRRL Y-17582) TaxID=931890 RepID=I6NDQ3_ERECY|nr:hypothetical protein Ecym_5444 [Eremothecium cymbalariae DBVPG\